MFPYGTCVNFQVCCTWACAYMHATRSHHARGAKDLYRDFRPSADDIAMPPSAAPTR